MDVQGNWQAPMGGTLRLDAGSTRLEHLWTVICNTLIYAQYAHNKSTISAMAHCGCLRRVMDDRLASASTRLRVRFSGSEGFKQGFKGQFISGTPRAPEAMLVNAGVSVSGPSWRPAQGRNTMASTLSPSPCEPTAPASLNPLFSPLNRPVGTALASSKRPKPVNGYASPPSRAV
jgi:hypothetical protein